MANVFTYNEIVNKAVHENLYHQLILQLNKDFKLAGVSAQLNEKITPNQLKTSLESLLNELFLHEYDTYLNLLYRIDISEKQLLKIESNTSEQKIPQVVLLILQREFQKVWFKNKL